MNIRFYLPAMAAIGLTAGALPAVAVAQSQDPAEASESQAATDTSGDTAEPETKRVCTMEKKTGSNFPRKVCRTVSNDSDDPEGIGALNDYRQRREAQQNTQQLGRSPS